MADNKNENQQSQPMMVDPIAYRDDYNGGYDKYIEGWDGTKLNNADVNISQYGDDSSAKNYNNSELRGGENQKYTGENTKNSQVAYNKDATLEGLDPNYKYGQAAQMENSQNANYIARRNDEIASALYNAGKTSVEDVANFLSSQSGWDYSNENERQNTIQSVWKRLGQIASENDKSNDKQPESNNVKEEGNNEALNNMESDLNQSTAGKLYGKNTADENNIIKTLEDENSVYRSMNDARIQSFKNLQAMDSQAIAAAVISGSIASDSQQMRDLMQYDPAKYQYVQQAVKQIRGQMNINAITSGEGDFTTVASNGQSSINNEQSDFALNNANSETSMVDILKGVNQSLESNQNAQTASEQMASIEGDMANLQNRLKNLKREASQVFKGDVPQYIVNAYIANRTAEIQDQLSILENRYNAAYSRYQTEWEQTKWNAEFDLKKQELDIKKQSLAFDQWATEQGLDLKRYTAGIEEWSTRESMALKRAELENKTGETTTKIPTSSLSREEIGTTIDNLLAMYKNGQLGKAQCAEGIQRYYLPSLGVSLGGLSSYSQKKGICNEGREYDAQVGDLIVMSSSSKPKNGHMGVVTSIDEDGTIHYLDWNGTIGKDGNGTEEAGERTIKKKDGKIYGYYNPTKEDSTLAIGGDGIWTRNDGTQFNLKDSPEYEKLDAKGREAVHQLLNNNLGKSSVTVRAGYKDPEGIFAAVSQINPLWSETDYNNRKQAEANWAKLEQGGATSRNATAVSTAKRIYDIVDSLDDKDLYKSDFKTINELINAGAEQIGNTKIVELKTLLNGLQSETAGALKGGNAAISDQDKRDMENILNVSLSKEQLKTAMEAMVRLLYDKNETEAKAIYNYGFYKKKPIWTDESVRWMNDDLGIDMSVYYDYSPNTKGKTMGGYAPKFDSDTYSGSSIADHL